VKKVVRAPLHEGVLGSGGIIPRIFNLVSRRRWAVSFTPRPLYLRGRNSLYPLDWRLGEAQSRFGHGGEEKKFHPLLLPWVETWSFSP